MQEEICGDEDSRPRPHNIVFEGGGVLGVAYIGAIEELHQRGLFEGLCCFAGTSIGAITAMICACRPNIATIRQVLLTIDIERMLDMPCLARTAYNLVVHRGLAPGNYALSWIRDILTTLCGDPDIKLAALEDKFDTKLVICVVNITKRRLEYITGKTHPDCSVAMLGRAAMSVSGLFIPVDLFNNGDLYVDGGLLNNYPIQSFHLQTPDGDKINPRTIGCMLFSDADAQVEFPPVGGLIDYGMIHLNLLWNWPQKQHMDEQDWARTIKIRTGKISSLNFKITQASVDMLIASGRDAVAAFVDGKETTLQSPFPSVHSQSDEEPRGLIDL
jgi:NTE family protein